MTSNDRGTVLDDVTVTVYRCGTALAQIDDIAPIYASAYAEAPYHEGPDDVAEFRAGWPRRVAQPSFRLVIARIQGEPAGFAFGHQLTTDTRWWDGMLDDVGADVVTEHPDRTFAVIELAVKRAMRRRGFAHELHTHLLAGLAEERATLLVRPDAEPARSAYLSWSYVVLGRLQPFPDGPVYNAMVRELRGAGRAACDRVVPISARIVSGDPPRDSK